MKECLTLVVVLRVCSVGSPMYMQVIRLKRIYVSRDEFKALFILILRVLGSTISIGLAIAVLMRIN